MARIDPLTARAILTVAGCNLEDNFHALPSWKVEALEVHANARRYRKPANANGSRLRYWHHYLVRQARKSVAGSDERQPLPVDSAGHCIHCGRDNRGHENEPCIDECPGYWEAQGRPHPEYPIAPSSQH